MNAKQTNLLSEEFEMPEYNADLQFLIEENLIKLEELPLMRRERREFKNKLNELIFEYNERRGMKIYNLVK